MFLLELAFILLVLFVLNVIVKLIMRKLLKIEKENTPFFSYNHINELHRKIDGAIGTTSTILMFVTSLYVSIEGYSINLMLIPLIFYVVLGYAVRAFFEYKYSETPRQHILTSSLGVIYLLVIVIIINFDLLIKISL